MSLWTKEQDDALISLKDAKLSFADIAAKLNEMLGTSFSRNAVIGRAHRMGWDRKIKIVRVQRPKAKVKLKNITLTHSQVKSVIIRKAPNIARPAELTKSELYAMLTEAVRNTARLSA